MTQRPPWTTLLTYLLGFLPICLLWNGNNAFYFDWNNHLWEIGYYGEYFRRHWAFPITINTEQAAGIPYPIFYGYLFYPAAGLISAFTGCSFALRFVCSLIFLFQVRQVSKGVESISGNRFVACAVTVLVSCATYPLTNLYNRAAITEFIAVSLVISVCMMWLRLVRMNDPLPRRRLLFGTALAMAFAMGTHPITAILGGCMVGFAMLASLPFPRDLWKPLGWAAALVCVVMAPWIYAVALFGRKVQLTAGFIGFFHTLDRFTTRFFPFPWDPHLGTEEFRIWATPYLDTQINFALLVLAIFLFFRIKERRREFYTALASFAGFALVCFMSMSRQPWRLVPTSLHFIQFAYRLVTYADLFLLLAVLFLLAGMRKVTALPDRPLMVVLTVCAALSTTSVTIKLLHAHRVEEPNTLPGSGWPNTNRDALLTLPSTLYGVGGYAVTIGSRGVLANGAAPSPASFPIGKQERFGEVLPVQITAVENGRLRTNIQIFPWNRIVWNGREIPFEETSTDQDYLTIIDRNREAGTLEYIFRPDPVWMALRSLSLGTVIIWAFGLCLLNYRTRNRKGSESTSPGFLT